MLNNGVTIQIITIFNFQITLRLAKHFIAIKNFKQKFEEVRFI